jgi:hypothetical protein
MPLENIDRSISPETSSLQIFQDDHDTILRLARESGCEPAELIRDIVSEGLSARRGQMSTMSRILQSLQELVDQNRLLIDQNRSANEANERLQVRAELAEQRWDSFERALIRNLREFYGIQLENLGTSLQVNNLLWKYVVRVIMDQSNRTQQQIEQTYLNEKKAAIEQRESIALAIEQAAESPESSNFLAFRGNQLNDLDVDLRSDKG